MARTIYGCHERFLDTYYRPYNGFYFSGDGAVRHSDGYFQITGRMDDVINVSGHRLGTAEVEDALVYLLLLKSAFFFLFSFFDAWLLFLSFFVFILFFRLRICTIAKEFFKVSEEEEVFGIHSGFWHNLPGTLYIVMRFLKAVSGFLIIWLVKMFQFWWGTQRMLFPLPLSRLLFIFTELFVNEQFYFQKKKKLKTGSTSFCGRIRRCGLSARYQRRRHLCLYHSQTWLQRWW